MVTSRLAQVGLAPTAAYCVSKTGLIGQTQSLAIEFASGGVRVNVVAPAVVNNDLSAASLKTGASAPHASEFPLGCFAEPNEIVASVLFRLSDSAAHSTGQALNPNVGSYMQQT